MLRNSLSVKAELDIEGKSFSRSLAEDSQVNGGDLQEEFLRQAELFAWWATMFELAKDKLSQLKTELSRKTAEIDYKIREDTKARNIDITLKSEKDGKKPVLLKLTEPMIENMTKSEQAYVEIENDLLNAKKQLGLLQAGKEAMVIKKDMLISLGANMRAEGMGNPVILRDAAKERSRRVHEEKKQIKEQYSVVQEEEPNTIEQEVQPKRKGIRFK